MSIALALVSFTLACGADPQVTLLGQAPWPYATGPGKEFVVRSVAELVAASPHKKKDNAEQTVMDDVTKALKVKNIDWKTQMLVVIRLEKIHPRGIVLGKFEIGKEELTLHYLYWEPVEAREGDAKPKPTDIAVMALADRFEGKVKFQGDQRTPK
jgi:hypothetical protein